MTRTEIAKLPQFDIRAPNARPPGRLVIHDLRKGTGAKMRAGDSMLVDFAGVKYGETLHTTAATKNRPEKFGFDEVIEGWQQGLPGMKVGGRRELIVPKGLGDAGSTAVYLVDLLAIYPTARE